MWVLSLIIADFYYIWLAYFISICSSKSFDSGYFSDKSMLINFVQQNLSLRTFYSQAQMISSDELLCPLPAASPISLLGPVLRWNVSVSNDGRTFGRALPLIVYDSRCQNCTNNGLCRLQVSIVLTKYRYLQRTAERWRVRYLICSKNNGVICMSLEWKASALTNRCHV